MIVAVSYDFSWCATTFKKFLKFAEKRLTDHILSLVFSFKKVFALI